MKFLKNNYLKYVIVVYVKFWYDEKKKKLYWFYIMVIEYILIECEYLYFIKDVLVGDL